MKRLICLLIFICGSTFGYAQTPLVIPSQTVVTPVTVNGTAIQLTITIPAQTVTIPAQGAAALPTGLTWANGVFTVAGSISTTQLALTGGPSLPPSTSGLYLWQLVTGVLQPVAYVMPTFTVPPLTVSQAASPINTITLTP